MRSQCLHEDIEGDYSKGRWNSIDFLKALACPSVNSRVLDGTSHRRLAFPICGICHSPDKIVLGKEDECPCR